MPDKTVSIIGLGWLGLPLANRLSAKEFGVKGSTTSAENISALQQQGIDVFTLQLNPEPIGNLLALLQADTLVINIPPKAGKVGADFHPEQLRHLTDAIGQSPIRHVIYVSSTSVYPELSREVIEEDVTTPDGSAAPALVQAERLVQRLSPAKLVTILRCGGLMGYNRIPGKYVAGKRVDSGLVPVNYLHRDDAVEILVGFIQEPVAGTFNAVSPEHPTREAIYRKSCADFAYQLPYFIAPAQAIPFKVISPAKLIERTNYQFRYPDPLQFFYEL
ncbi:Rossmann-fold NAD(P)-binding domain-containing protein [Spirosoma areae]